MKSKLGVSVGLLGVFIYLAALFGGYVAIIIVGGYVLLVEENEWLKKTAVKAVALLVFFSGLTAVIHLIPDALSWIASLVSIFHGVFDYDILSSIIDVIIKAIDIVRTVLFLALAAKAINQSTVSVPVIDNLINKYM